MLSNNLQGASCLREVVEGVCWTEVLPGKMVTSVDGTCHQQDWGRCCGVRGSEEAVDGL